MQQTCPQCSGYGEMIGTPCNNCNGNGKVQTNENVPVKIPKGVDDGTRIRLSGKGEAGSKGGSSGITRSTNHFSITTTLRTSLLHSKETLVSSYLASSRAAPSNRFDPLAAPLPEHDLQDLYVEYFTFFSVPL